MATAASHRSAEALFNSFRQAATGLKSTFCCGGTVHSPAATPTTIWYKTASQRGGKLVLPLKGKAEGALKTLIHICEPASFGRGGNKVFDSTYRTALKLEPSQFATSFELSNHGILEEVRNLMMPTHSSIQAQLYKLNIMGEGGHFKSHVDTPTGGQMFGSLVVCLPVSFTGGELTVKQKEQLVTFDWAEETQEKGTKQKKVTNTAAVNPHRAIRWAAFYSDCEHIIKPVTSGHRLTLTYNLFAHDDTKKPPTSTISPSTLPLHDITESLLSHKSFMPNGGRLGFGSQHTYPHTTRGFVDNLELMLKGVDMTTWKCMEESGLNPTLRPVYSFEFDESDDSDEYPSESDEEKEDTETDNGIDLSILQERGIYVGKKMHEIKSSHYTRELEGFYNAGEEITEVGRHDNDDIVWCVSPRQTSQVAGACGAYGNDPTTEFFYSAAAIVVDVPSWKERNKMDGLGSEEKTMMKKGKKATVNGKAR